jgi:hypothetical protein
MPKSRKKKEIIQTHPRFALSGTGEIRRPQHTRRKETAPGPRIGHRENLQRVASSASIHPRG